ncbi:hypothetical protein Ssi03_58560 [Sphaerisporangium siamense]|uniref:DUF1931 family protein n=1 Tax=Sphaerisporangium siamense TaxID=795645 RepID=A0A7W7D3V1_9ACTN|nr:DUF1931 family protein [Sphaerisporangium siamense]MBB4699687.1 hypothetical protein [Sphaerisporangium siamense]GII87866.1 hypothetical protein Ssi03_58560 [Sphaerisporangium siamense]
MVLMAVPRFERFFRAAAGLDVDKADLRRYNDFVNGKLYDLLVIAEAHAKANGRDVVEPWDLPVTKGLQESIHRFRELDHDIALTPVLERLAAFPPLNGSLGTEVVERLPEVVGGLSLALARTFKILDPGRKNPTAEEWDRAISVFELLL